MKTSDLLPMPCDPAKDGVCRRGAAYYVLFLCLGLNAAVIGPTLPALALQTQVPLARMGWVFLLGGGGFTLGTFVAGRIFDRVHAHPVLAVAQAAVAAMVFLIPWIPSFPLLLAVLVCKGLAEGFVNTGVNTLLVWTHGRRVAPYMNALHFCFGLGAFLAPALVAQVVGVEGGYRWAYWALACVSLLAAYGPFRLSDAPRRAHDDDAGQTGSSAGFRGAPFVLAAALYLFFYVGAEVAFSGWIYTYALALGLADARAAAYLTSAFWLAFTLGRLASIPVAARVSAPRVVIAALAACMVLLAMAIAMADSSRILWIAAMGLGWFMAPIWPTGFALAGQSLRLTASVSAVILLGDGLGGMVLPSLVGRIMGITGPRGLMVVVFSALVCNLLAFIYILNLRPGRERGPQSRAEGRNPSANPSFVRKGKIR